MKYKVDRDALIDREMDADRQIDGRKSTQKVSKTCFSDLEANLHD